MRQLVRDGILEWLLVGQDAGLAFVELEYVKVIGDQAGADRRVTQLQIRHLDVVDKVSAYHRAQRMPDDLRLRLDAVTVESIGEETLFVLKCHDVLVLQPCINLRIFLALDSKFIIRAAPLEHNHEVVAALRVVATLQEYLRHIHALHLLVVDVQVACRL